MSEAALISVEITITDPAQQKPPMTIALGGPKKAANDMAKALAERLGVPAPPRGRLLSVEMTTEQLQATISWMKDRFPQIRFSTNPERASGALLASAPAGKSAPISPWRKFNVQADDDVMIDEATVKAIAMLVDLLYKQHQAWGFHPDRPLGAVVENSDPILRISVEPSERCIYVDHLPADMLPDRSKLKPVDVIPT